MVIVKCGPTLRDNNHRGQSRSAAICHKAGNETTFFETALPKFADMALTGIFVLTLLRYSFFEMSAGKGLGGPATMKLDYRQVGVLGVALAAVRAPGTVFLLI